MSPYRDPSASLRARSAELDRLLADRRKEVAELRSQPVPSSLPLFALTAVLLLTAGIGFWFDLRLLETHPREHNLAPLHWEARVISGNREGLARGTECTVDVAPPCTAIVHCGAFGYHGEGVCSDCSFTDSSTTDGNPACHIDAATGHAFLRGEVVHPLTGPEEWWADLVQR